MELLVEACGSRGSTAGKYAYCQVGQSYMRNVVPEVQALAENRKRILMIGLYLASSAKSIHQRGIVGHEECDCEDTEAHASSAQNLHQHQHGHAGHRHLYEGIEIRFSEKGIIDHPSMLDWVWDAATAAISSK
jgi:hypothetical protein